MWIPSFSNSPWMRGAPQSGLAAAIFRIRALTAGLASGRPLFRLEIQVQNRRKPLRCQATTVSGLTMINTQCQSFPTPGQPHPEEAIRPSQPKARALSLEHCELLTKGQILQGDISEVRGRNEKTKQ